MTRVIASMLLFASFLMYLTGCDTSAGKGATPPSRSLATPSNGPTTGGSGKAGTGAGSTAPMVLPPPPGSDK